ncbi:biliverdin-producing heme oxygenase [Parenemella sanctibonifatiensis]|uniref:Biliverdin-producing heme oxygenase n=1 Tax=Parenemella sanctibonifatiensis TaxID=2016505 RepID=A0A255ED48_9ACTN|nr:biliverdin-producing heme oxygenase [Parenemella sanctibonifatiensis]OYN89200.1 biliverdin-producing heme oxygenase [Parenemella sanctibonifatiensis]
MTVRTSEPTAHQAGLGLSARLRSATSEAHEGAEQSPFIAKLVEGSSSVDAVLALMVQQHVLYEAMEKVQGSLAADPLLTFVHDHSLDRSEALAADLLRLIGPGWQGMIARDELPVMDATRAYVDRVLEADPEWLVANHYVRYLGDLSGGQILGVLFGRHYGLTGLEFYRFPSITKVKPYKDRYRAQLDLLGNRHPEAADRIVIHASDAFRRNAALFGELEQHVAA